MINHQLKSQSRCETMQYVVDVGFPEEATFIDSSLKSYSCESSIIHPEG